MLGDVLSHASRNIIESYYRLKNGGYRVLRDIYPDIPSHYIHGLCQDAVERVSPLRRNKAEQYSREIFNELVNYTANLIVRDALRMRGVIVIGRISGDDIRIMIARYRDKQLRHRIISEYIERRAECDNR
jgi:putative transposase